MKQELTEKEIDQLVDNLDPRAKLPRGFSFYSLTFQIIWLRQHQKKEKPDGRKTPESR